MPDIFISYSRKDSVQALALAERLRTSGMSVWIDQHGIEAATLWSNEIVQAIDAAMAVIVLLSSSSVTSDNVVRELSLAFEAKKTILPIDLEAVTLPPNVRYQLAGIQRAQLSDFEGIVRSLTKLGLVPASTLSAIKVDFREADTRTSLMVLPFEDLSPRQDNGWFADGLASELIDMLGHIKSLRLIDRKTSMDFKGFRGTTMEIAGELNVRYFIEGNVRKFGDLIKISVALLDVKEGEYLWQESHKGAFADIFEIQERVAENVVAGLKLHLTPDEQERLKERGTEQAEAYELNLMAASYGDLITKQGLLQSVPLLEEAIQLDPEFVIAHLNLSNTCILLYNYYSRDELLLDRAERAIRESQRLKPDFAPAYSMEGLLLLNRLKPEAAISAAKKAVDLAPNVHSTHAQLAFIYDELGRSEEAANAYEESLRLVPDNLGISYNLALQYHKLGDLDRLRVVARRALPHFATHRVHHPDDQNKRANYAILLFFAGEFEKSKREIDAILSMPGLDGGICYNCACLYYQMDDTSRTIELLEKSIELGFVRKELFLIDPGLAPLRLTDEWRRLMTKLDAVTERNTNS